MPPFPKMEWIPYPPSVPISSGFSEGNKNGGRECVGESEVGRGEFWFLEEPGIGVGLAPEPCKDSGGRSFVPRGAEFGLFTGEVTNRLSIAVPGNRWIAIDMEPV